MKVTLLSYTPEALELLLFSKNTRLSLSPSGWDEVRAWPLQKKIEELLYMLGTIPSSWEFVDYVFSIEGVSRAFTHQLVRHRVGTSFAQQSQRTVEMSGFDYVTGAALTGVRRTLYEGGMNQIDRTYREMLARGAKPEDARGLLPTNIATNILFKANLRALSEMAAKRLCIRTQDEFRRVMVAMRNAVLDVHPWADRFLRVACAMTSTCPFAHVKPEECPVKPYVLNPISGEAFGGGPVAQRRILQEVWADTLGKEATDEPRVAVPGAE